MNYFRNIKVEIPEDCRSCTVIQDEKKKGKAFICQHCKVKIKEMTDGN